MESIWIIIALISWRSEIGNGLTTIPNASLNSCRFSFKRGCLVPSWLVPYWTRRVRWARQTRSGTIRIWTRGSTWRGVKASPIVVMVLLLLRSLLLVNWRVFPRNMITVLHCCTGWSRNWRYRRHRDYFRNSSNSFIVSLLKIHFGGGCGLYRGRVRHIILFEHCWKISNR